MAEAIAVVLKVDGDVWARSADGEMRLLQEGDAVYVGETVVTAQNARVSLDLGSGETVQLASGQFLLMSDEMLADAQSSSDEQTVTDAGVEEVLALLEGDGDILEQLEDPAAGTTGGGDAGGAGRWWKSAGSSSRSTRWHSTSPAPRVNRTSRSRA
ncbi:retention module-containing protein [Guyparkeria halophila]|uniref:Retention module-containing protein n=1 Tax=Guyparkeria halophila TaxID=47960 RepID=A0ABZ0YYH1_9GAMM|nr:retention module-containing protein [Guyparkeria halophila]WQH17233.1 retention module-containing protein [Guyparkeria halophila]